MPWLSRAFAQQENPALKAMMTAPISVSSVTGDVLLVTGPGGNIAVLAGKDGQIQIDSMVPGRAQDIMNSVKAKTNQNTKLLINTHWHFDHTGCNKEFAEAGAKIIAQVNTRKRMSTTQNMDFMNMKFDPSPAAALPKETFATVKKLKMNGEQLHLEYMPPAHTDGDIIIHFQNANVLHAGDLFFNGVFPLIDYSSGGWLGGMVGASQKMLKMIDDNTKVIPGHGPLATKADLQRYYDMLAASLDRLAQALKDGKSADEVVAAAPLKDLADVWGKGMLNVDLFTRIAYVGMQRRKG